MAKYRKKPVVINAIRWDGSNIVELNEMAGIDFATNYGRENDGALKIHTLEGTMHVAIGDWVIKGVRGELYPCKHEIFAETYEVVQ